MENLCILPDFDIDTYPGKFQALESPAGFDDYTIYRAANCIYIRSPRQKTVRFNYWGKKISDIAAQDIQTWISTVKKQFPKF